MTRSVPGERVQQAAAHRVRSRAPVAYCTSSGSFLVLAMVAHAGHGPAPSARACRRRRRSFPGSRGRPQTAAGRDSTTRGISGSVVASRCGSCSVSGSLAGPRVTLRLDVRGTARQQDAVERRSSSSSRSLLTQRRDQQRHRIRGIGHGGDVFFADAVEGVRSEDPAIRRDADQWFAPSHV